MCALVAWDEPLAIYAQGLPTCPNSYNILIHQVTRNQHITDIVHIWPDVECFAFPDIDTDTGEDQLSTLTWTTYMCNVCSPLPQTTCFSAGN